MPPIIRFRIDFENDCNLGPGKIALLEKIGECGSLSAAARVLGMSYRRAWLLVDSLNKTFKKPITVNSAGGVGGGGTEVTDFGRLLIERYRQMDKLISDIGLACLAEILPQLSQASGKADNIKRMLTKSARRH